MVVKKYAPGPAETTGKIDRATALASVQALRAQPPSGADPVQAFAKCLQSQAGIVHKIASPEELVRYVRDTILSGESSEAEVAIGVNPQLSPLPWGEEGKLKVTTADAIRHGGIAVSTAELAVAETGSLVLCSGPENPTLLNFLPDHHVVLVNEKDIVSHQEEMWAHLRQRYPQGLPRAINLVSGPSSTADVAVTFTFGAHGPMQVHALILSATDN